MARRTKDSARPMRQTSAGTASAAARRAKMIRLASARQKRCGISVPIASAAVRRAKTTRSVWVRRVRRAGAVWQAAADRPIADDRVGAAARRETSGRATSMIGQASSAVDEENSADRGAASLVRPTVRVVLTKNQAAAILPSDGLLLAAADLESPAASRHCLQGGSKPSPECLPFLPTNSGASGTS